MNSLEIQELKLHIIARMQENTPRIARCLDDLTEAEIWQRPNPSSNSIGNLILHLCGNIGQYAIASLGGRPDTRQRDREFEAREGFGKQELLERLDHTVHEACAIIVAATDADMMRRRRVQGFDMSGIGIVVHVCEHYSYHTGQIAFWVKQLRDKDLGFYAGQNLNAVNED